MQMHGAMLMRPQIATRIIRPDVRPYLHLHVSSETPVVT